MVYLLEGDLCLKYSEYFLSCNKEEVQKLNNEEFLNNRGVLINGLSGIFA